MKTNYVISVEIGSSKTKVAAAAYDPALGAESPVSVVALEQEPLSNSVRYGRVQNVEEVTRKTQIALERLAGRAALFPRKVVGAFVALGGRSLASMHASVSDKLSPSGDAEITQATIERLKELAEHQVPENREALQVIPVRYIVDGTPTTNPVGSFGHTIQAEFTVVVCDRANIRNLNRVVYERLGLDLSFVVRPLAIAALSLGMEEVRLGCMLVDCGAETTTVSIYKDGALQYLATIPMGSRHITADLAAGLGMIEEEAEKIKKAYGRAISEPSENVSAEQADIDNYVQARASEIIANILAQISFAGYDYSDIRTKGIVVTGQGALLRNFCHLLEVESNLPVRMASAPGYVRVADPDISLADNLDIAAVCVEGARLQGAESAMACVEGGPAEPEPSPEPEVEKPRQAPAPAPAFDEPSADDPDDGSNPFANAYETVDDPRPRRRRQVDDEDLLVDDYEADIRRRERAQKLENQHRAEIARQQAKIDELTQKLNRQKQKPAKKESDSESGGSGWANKIRDRLAKLISDVDAKGDGSDYADEE